MSSSFSAPPPSPAPIQPLSVGNVVSAGFRLYTRHLTQFLGISLQASLWVITPLILILGLFFYTFGQENAAPGAVFLLFLVFGIAYLYCLGRYLANSGAISRLVFQELTNQPESPDKAQKITTSRQWSFLGSVFLVWLVMVGVYLLGVIVISIPLGLLMASSMSRFSASRTGMPDPSMLIGAGLWVLVGLLIFLVLVSWLYARLSMAQIPIAVESRVTASQSLGRSWALTQKNAWRILLIFFVGFLITIPLVIPIQIINLMLDRMIRGIFPARSVAYQVASVLFSMILGFLSSIFLMPFWQSIKAVIYYDLRSRREGLGLTLRNRSSEF